MVTGESSIPGHVTAVAAPTSAGLSHAVRTFVWGAEGAVPGRHPELVSNAALRARVEKIIGAVDSIRPDADAADLAAWAGREVRAIATRFPELDDTALRALRDLLTWTWR